jgi:hypothetical protein
MIEKYVNNLVNKNIIEPANRNYGIRQGIIIIINIATVVAIGLALSLLAESMIS